MQDLTADFSVIDTNIPWKFKCRDSFYREEGKDERFPFENYELTGDVYATYVRGNVVYENGQIKADAGTGMFIGRNSWMY